MGQTSSLLLADLLHPHNQNKMFPYAAGCIGAYAKSQLGERVSVDVFRSPEELGAAVLARRPEIVGFTNYIWNIELAYEIVRQLKEISPTTVVVMGGPNYPSCADDQRRFLEAHSLVDFYVHKEGEIPFEQLLSRLIEADFDVSALKHSRLDLPAVHYLDMAGDLIAPPPSARQRELDSFPSPYLSGLLEKFFLRSDLVPLIQTKRGCPFQCTFCVEGEEYYSKLGSVSTGRVRAELEYIAARMANGSPRLYIADSNFGMYGHDLEICDVIAEVRDRYGWPKTIEVSTGKNRTERVLEAVRRTRGAMRFGPALQSTDRQTLQNIKRSNISETMLLEMAASAGDLEQRSFTELILALPGDTVETHLQSIRAAMDAGIQRIKMYPLVLLPGTEMASVEGRSRFGLQTRFRLFPQCHGTYRFVGETFPSVEIAELVIATDTMSVEDYLYCKRFELSVEIFYNDIYLQEIHGLARALGLSMFTFVERCHSQLDQFPSELRSIYDALESGLRDDLFATGEACLEYYRDPAHLRDYAAQEYKNSLGTLKAIALLEHIEPLLAVARTALWDSVAAKGIASAALSEYIDELIEYSRLRRRRILDTGHEPEGTFRFAFDRIREFDFEVDPAQFRLKHPRRLRFFHDERQTRDIRALCDEVSNPALRARSFIYPLSDPGVNPYLRRSSPVE